MATIRKRERKEEEADVEELASSLDAVSASSRESASAAKRPREMKVVSAKPKVSLSPAKALAGRRILGMFRRVLADDLLKERALALENAKNILRSGEKRARRSAKLLRNEKAGEALVGEVRNILSRARSAMSTEDGYLESDEEKAVRQDLAAAALLFHQQGAAIDREDRAYLNRLLNDFVPIFQKAGKSERAARAALQKMFKARARSSEVRAAIKSVLGTSEMSRLASVLAESASLSRSSAREVPRLLPARELAKLRDEEEAGAGAGAVAMRTRAKVGAGGAGVHKGAALSASASEERNKRARAAVLARYRGKKGRKGSTSRSADTRSAGTSSLEAIRTSSGSLRSARASTRTSTQSFKSEMLAKAAKALRSLNIAKERTRRGAKPIERFGKSAIVMREIQDLVKAFKGAQQMKNAAQRAKKIRDLRVELVMTLLLQTPARLSEESRLKLVRGLSAMFPSGEAAAIEALSKLIAKKKDATLLSGKSQKTMRLSKYVFGYLAKLLTKSEVEAVKSEVDNVSEVSTRSASRSSRSSKTPRRSMSPQAKERALSYARALFE
jgi:hypothetical protein